MSTKIFNAYRFARGGAEAAFKWLLGFRKRYQAFVFKKMKGLFRPEAKFSQVAELLRACTREGLDNDFNLKASAVVYLHRGKVYVQFFGVDWEYLRDSVGGSPYFEDWHYQNSTDRPLDVLPRIWAARKQCWEEIMAQGGGSFAECGLVFELVPKHFEYEVARAVCKDARED